MIHRTHLVGLGLLELAAIALSAAFYFALPDTVPVHWNLAGAPDRHGSKWGLLLIMPAVSASLILLMLILPRLGPFRANFGKFRTTYGRLLITLISGFLGLHLVILLSARGEISIGPSIALVLGLMMTVVGNWLGKVRRNFYIGIRTPWTLANEEVWERTHRVASRVFVAWGLAVFLTGLTGSSLACFVVCVGGAVAVVTWAVAYSLYCYRRQGGVDDLGPEVDA